MASQKTDSANAAINAADPAINAIVSASAGTGKTWLLIARLLRLLLAGKKPDSILAITFTKKAAAEIKERLYLRLREWSQMDEKDLSLALKEIGIQTPNQFIQKAQTLFENLLHNEHEVMILTFHSFCAQLLQQFPFDKDISGNFEVLEDDSEIQHQAYDRLLRTAMTQEKLYQALDRLTETCSYSLANVRETLFNFLSQRNSWLAYTDNQTSNDNQSSDAAANNIADEIADRLKKEMVPPKPEAMVLEQRYIENLKSFADLVRAHGKSRFIGYAESLEQMLEDAPPEWNEDFLAKAKKALLAKDDGKKKAFDEPSNAFIETLEKNGSNYEDFKALYELLVAELQIAKEFIYCHKNWQRNQSWYIAGQRLIEIYQDIKKSHQMMDFDDLEWNANCLLNDPGKGAEWVQFRLNERIHHILVDEFQDTNPTQWQLLKPLLDEMASQESDSSVFIVGDTKQSIYGFRRANPKLQQEASNWIQEHLGGKEYTLDKSRRSSPEVIRLVNEVCLEEQSFRRHFEDFKKHSTVVETPGQCARLPFAASDAKAEKAAEKEAEYVADKIYELIAQKTLVHIAGEEPRPAKYSDVLILFRRGALMPVFEAALRQRNIPHQSASENDLLDTLEISDLIALLRFFADPADNLSLIHALRSPIFSASDEQMIALAKNSSEHSWLKRLAHIAENEDEAFWKRSFQLLDTWLKDADRLPIHDLFDKIYMQGDVIRRYRLAASNEYKNLVEHNLINFLNYTLDFEGGRYPGIDGFLNYLTFRKRHSIALNIGGGSDSSTGHINLMTIHKAKGLESPIVFLADTGEHRSHKDTYKALIDWPSKQKKPKTFLLLPPLRERDAFTKEFIDFQQQREEAEEANLLYVAITRARQYLFVSGHHKGKEEESGLYATLKQYLNALPAPKTSEGMRGKAQQETVQLLPKSVDAPPLKSEKSPSQLSTLAPDAKFYRDGDEDGLLRGSIIHRGLELINDGDEAELIDKKLKTDFPDVENSELKRLMKDVYRLKNDPQLSKLFDDDLYRKVFNEVPISFIYEAQQYYGTIDRLCIGEDSVWIIDYKTHTKSEERLQKLKQHYREQMYAYHIGIQQLYPQLKTRCSLLFTETGKLVDYDFSAENKA